MWFVILLPFALEPGVQSLSLCALLPCASSQPASCRVSAASSAWPERTSAMGVRPNMAAHGCPGGARVAAIVLLPVPGSHVLPEL